MQATLGLTGIVVVFWLMTALQLGRLERKVNRIVKHLGLEHAEPSDRVKQIANDPARKIEAIRAYREETGADLKEAKEAVEGWIAANP